MRRSFFLQPFVLCMLIVTLYTNGSARAIDRRVPTDYPTIQAAIDACVDGDEVIVEPNTHTGTGNTDLDLLGKAITVRSTDPNDPNVVAATVIGGSGTGFNIHCGEGRYSVVAGLTISRCSVGIFISNHSNPVIRRCTITGCFGFSGIYCLESDAAISECTITDNPFGVGGILSENGSPTIDNCIVCRNTIVPFFPVAGGFGIGCGGGGPRISNCTISGNTSEGTYSVVGIICQNSAAHITNSIIWCNGSGPNEIEAGPNDVVSYCDVRGGYPGEGNINIDPSFAPQDTYYLMPGSPCIDAGTNNPPAGLPATDIDGFPRLADGDGEGNAVVDMGAREKLSLSPLLLVDPRELEVSTYLGGPNPDNLILTVINVGGGSLAASIVEDSPWLAMELMPAQDTSQGAAVALNVDASGLSIGDYECRVEVSDANALNSPLTVPVKLHVRRALRVPSECPTIQAGIDAAQPYETVLVADGTYTGPGNKDLDFHGKAITVRGEGGSSRCVIDCQGAGHGFYFHSGEGAISVVEGLTIRNGRRGLGNGISCEGASPTIRNCTLSGSIGDYYAPGGGVYCHGSQANFLNCVISGNSASIGSAIDAVSRSRLTLVNCLISNNKALNWDTMHFDNSSAVLINCAITDNFVGPSGVSIMCRDLRMVNCILWGNTAPLGYHVGSMAATVNYCDIQDGPNAIHSYNNGCVTWGVGNINADPLFANPNGPDGDPNTWQDNDYRLTAWSPCKNAGDPRNLYVSQTDLDNQPRIMGGRIDMGAYEWKYGYFRCGSGAAQSVMLLGLALALTTLTRLRK
jgi:hypothetical protein